MAIETVRNRYSTAGFPVAESFSDGASHVTEDCIATVVDLATDSTVVTASAARLVGIYVNTVLSAHTCLIADNATTKFTLPASLAAGTFIGFHGARFDTNITIDPNDAATGNITVLWRAQ